MEAGRRGSPASASAVLVRWPEVQATVQSAPERQVPELVVVKPMAYVSVHSTLGAALEGQRLAATNEFSQVVGESPARALLEPAMVAEVGMASLHQWSVIVMAAGGLSTSP